MRAGTRFSYSIEPAHERPGLQRGGRIVQDGQDFHALFSTGRRRSGDNRPRVGGSELGRARRGRRDVLQHEGHERVFVVDTERRVVAPFEAYSGHGIAAEAATAHRPRERAGKHFEIIGQRLETPQAAKEFARPIFGARDYSRPECENLFGPSLSFLARG